MRVNTVWIPAFFTIWCLPIQNVSVQRFFESFCYVTMWFLGCLGLFYHPAGVIVCLIHAPLLNTTIIHVFTCWSLGVFTNTYFSSEDLSFCKNCPVWKRLQAMKVSQALELRMNLSQAHLPQARKTQYETEETQDVTRKTEWERRRCIFRGLTVTTAHIWATENTLAEQTLHLYDLSFVLGKQHDKHKIIPTDYKIDWGIHQELIRQGLYKCGGWKLTLWCS